MGAPQNRSWALTEAGAAAGSFNGNLNGTAEAPKTMRIIPDEVGQVSLHLNRMIIQIEDDAPITAAGYGGLSVLTNGIRVQHTSDDGAVVTDLDAGIPIKSSSHWARLAYDYTPQTFGSGNNFVTVRWTFGKTGKLLVLHPGEELKVTISDNLSTLVGHYFIVQGFGNG